MEITQVKEFNKKMLRESRYILVFTLGNGSMVDEPRKNGYVVSGYCGNDSHRWFNNKQEAIKFIKSK